MANLKTYTFSGNMFNLDADLSIDEVREKIAQVFDEVRDAEFQATSDGGNFVVRSGTKG